MVWKRNVLENTMSITHITEYAQHLFYVENPSHIDLSCDWRRNTFYKYQYVMKEGSQGILKILAFCLEGFVISVLLQDYNCEITSTDHLYV